MKIENLKVGETKKLILKTGTILTLTIEEIDSNTNTIKGKGRFGEEITLDGNLIGLISSVSENSK